jgi:hypothetical protein
MAAVSEVVVLRLRGDQVGDGRLVGWAEAVRSGRKAALRPGDDPVAVLLALLRGDGGTPSEAREGT